MNPTKKKDTMKNNWNIQDNIEIGMTQFYEGQIQDAYTCFTTALNLDPNNETALTFRAKAALQLYDHRRNTALEDIELALKINPFKGQLYLLENQILLAHHDKYQEAIKRLQKSQFKIFHNDPDIRHIRKLVKELKQKQMNYVVQMPPEVIHTIFTLLPLRSRVQCLAVSCQWRNTLSRIPDLWRDLDYSQQQEEVVIGNDDMMMMNSHRSTVTTPHYWEASIAASLDRFMQWLDIRKLTVPLTMNIVEKLIKRRPELVEVSFLGGMVTIDPLVLQLVMREIGSTWRKVEFDSAIKPFIFYHAASMYCPELTELTIHQGHLHHNMPNSVAQLLRPIPTLTTLCLCHCNFSTMFTIISQICPELTDLTMESSDQLMYMTMDFYNMLRKASKLKRLTLRDRFPKHARDLIEVIRVKSFEWLDINNFPLTREGILGLVEVMQSGILKCYSRTFCMDRPEARKTLKQLIDQKQPVHPPHHERDQQHYQGAMNFMELLRSTGREIPDEEEDEEGFHDQMNLALDDLAEEFYYAQYGGVW
ncbi:hypothetical protein BDA99DRAFT_508081 [Phascolomyces articulosus]|uniref:F-box domain-containing protein n=1 Tax=Phascolomyces articulosus TaxID=60185 RepID=A0AAD5PEZ9_9FUNG|nr:hypothetical protein BDA99DRAFT_508081 [Phascolomyces articulosus]